MSPQFRQVCGQYGAAIRHGTDEEVRELRHRVVAGRVEEAIVTALTQEPDLALTDRERLAALILPDGRAST